MQCFKLFFKDKIFVCLMRILVLFIIFNQLEKFENLIAKTFVLYNTDVASWRLLK